MAPQQFDFRVGDAVFSARLAIGVVDLEDFFRGGPEPTDYVWIDKVGGRENPLLRASSTESGAKA